MTDNDRVSAILSLDAAPSPTIDTVLPVMDSIVEQAMLATDLALEVEANQMDAQYDAAVAGIELDEAVSTVSDDTAELAATREQLQAAQATIHAFIAREAELQCELDAARQDGRTQTVENSILSEELAKAHAALAKYQRGVLSSRDMQALYAPQLELLMLDLQEAKLYIQELQAQVPVVAVAV